MNNRNTTSQEIVTVKEEVSKSLLGSGSKDLTIPHQSLTTGDGKVILGRLKTILGPYLIRNVLATW